MPAPQRPSHAAASGGSRRDRAPRPLPRPVRDQLASRRASLLAGLGPDARVLDLDLPGDAAARGALAGTAAGTLDAIVGVARLATHPAPAELLTVCFELLRPGGRLLLVEPYRRPGATGRLQSLAAPAVERVFGLRVDLPVPALVRAAGFVIATIERFTMPTPLVPLRPFAAIDARAGTAPVDPSATAGAETEGGRA